MTTPMPPLPYPDLPALPCEAAADIPSSCGDEVEPSCDSSSGAVEVFDGAEVQASVTGSKVRLLGSETEPSGVATGPHDAFQVPDGYVLFPKADVERMMALIAETVAWQEDYLRLKEEERVKMLTPKPLFLRRERDMTPAILRFADGHR